MTTVRFTCSENDHCPFGTRNKKYPCVDVVGHYPFLASLHCKWCVSVSLVYPLHTHINLLNMRLFYFHVFRSTSSSSFSSFHAILFLRAFVLRRFVRISIKFQFYNVNIRMQQRREQDSQRAASVVFVRCIIYINKCIGNNREARKILFRFVHSAFAAFAKQFAWGRFLAGLIYSHEHTHTLIVFAPMTT